MSELAASIKTPKIIGSDKKCGSECEAGYSIAHRLRNEHTGIDVIAVAAKVYRSGLQP